MLQWRLSAQSFAVLQWGLAIAIPAPGGLELVTYNFWVAPGSTGTGSDDQRFLCQAGPTLSLLLTREDQPDLRTAQLPSADCWLTKPPACLSQDHGSFPHHRRQSLSALQSLLLV